MSQLVNCSDSQVRWIHKYLYLIKLLDSKVNTVNKEDISIDDLIESSKSLIAQKSALIVFEDLRLGNFQIKDENFLFHLKKRTQDSKTKFSIVLASHNLEMVIDHEFIDPLCDDANLIELKINKALSIIEKISLEWKAKITESVLTISGLNDCFNVINSGFTKDYPGFISLNINADLPIIGEEIVHECTHLLFDNLVYFNSEIREIIKKIPPVFSVFAKKPRSIELVLHGLFSYTSVYLFWENLSNLYPDERDRSKNRRGQVIIYIREAVKSLNNVLHNVQWEEIKDLYKSICPVFRKELWDFEFGISEVSTEIIDSLRDNLNNIECAEILLALEENKVSRISKPISQITDIIGVIDRLPVLYCFSDHIFSSYGDVSINDFHNVIGNTYSLNSLDTHIGKELNIHIYIASNREDLLNAFNLDKVDDCGELFGTPKCCEAHFKSNWDYAVENYKGDMTRYYYENQKKKLVISSELEYNPIPMYFDKGFCWHFPCTLTCEATKGVIDKRIDILRKYPQIFEELILKGKYELHIDTDRNYQIVEIE